MLVALLLRLQSNQETFDYQSLLSGLSDLKILQHFHPSHSRSRLDFRRSFVSGNRAYSRSDMATFLFLLSVDKAHSLTNVENLRQNPRIGS